MLSFWLPIFFVPPIFGYLLGRVRPSRWRLGLLTVFVAAPPVVFTVWMATARPAPEGFLVWWWIGMGMIFVPEVIWAMGAFVGYLVGKRTVG